MSSLTAAYVAIGAHAALRAENDDAALSRLIEAYSGELNLIGDVTEDAAMLDGLARMAGDRLTGVFVYEVAEPYGAAMVEAMLKGDEPDREAIARKLLADTLIR